MCAHVYTHTTPQALCHMPNIYLCDTRPPFPTPPRNIPLKTQNTHLSHGSCDTFHKIVGHPPNLALDLTPLERQVEHSNIAGHARNCQRQDIL
jgi:hypothetical protein